VNLAKLLGQGVQLLWWCVPKFSLKFNRVTYHVQINCWHFKQTFP